MTLTYLLEMSVGMPRQFRITVLEDVTAVLIAHRLDSGKGFVCIGNGYYATPEACIAAMSPYVLMENG